MIPDLMEKSYQIMEVDTYNSHSNQASDGSNEWSFNYSCAGADGRALDQEGFGGWTQIEGDWCRFWSHRNQ